MVFVYKPKHVEDGIPAFRINRLSCCGRYIPAFYRPFGFKGLIASSKFCCFVATESLMVGRQSWHHASPYKPLVIYMIIICIL